MVALSQTCQARGTTFSVTFSQASGVPMRNSPIPPFTEKANALDTYLYFYPSPARDIICIGYYLRSEVNEGIRIARPNCVNGIFIMNL